MIPVSCVGVEVSCIEKVTQIVSFSETKQDDVMRGAPIFFSAFYS